jgi:hypothetical protein
MYMLANSSGTLNAAVNSGITNTNYSQAIPIDYNADGLEDFLVPYSGGTWWVVQGSTSGLTSPVNTGITASGAGGNARAMDVNGDGLDDLVWANIVGGGNDSIQVRYRVWGGTFGAPSNIIPPVGTNLSIVGPVFGDTPFLSRRRLPDFNGDDRGDFIYHYREFDPESGTYTHYWQVQLAGGGGFTITNLNLAGAPVWVDLNGDGMTDILYNWNTTWRYRFSRGTSMGAEINGPANMGLVWDSVTVIDWDNDGYEDIVTRKNVPANWFYLRSNGESLAAAVDTGLASPALRRYAGDVNGDGLDDLLYVGGSNILVHRAHSGVEPDLMTTATDGYGNTVTFNYAPLTSANYTKYAGATFPEQDYQGASYVVNSASASNGIGSTYTLTYQYYGARLHRQGRGFEGFYARRAHDSRNGLYAYEYLNRLFPYTGTSFQSDLYQPNASTLIARAQQSWTSHSYGAGFDTRYLPYVSSSTTTRYEFGGTYNGALLSTAATTNTVDSATGTLYDSTTTTTEAGTANGIGAGQSHAERTYHSSLYTDTTNWCIGRPEVTQAINSHTMYGGSSLTRQANTTWDGLYCRPTQSVRQQGDSQWQVTTGLGYDAFGNLSSETVTGIGMSGRTTSVSWGATGAFPVTITNALSQSPRRAGTIPSACRRARQIRTASPSPGSTTISGGAPARIAPMARRQHGATTTARPTAASAPTISSSSSPRSSPPAVPR